MFFLLASFMMVSGSANAKNADVSGQSHCPRRPYATSTAKWDIVNLLRNLDKARPSGSGQETRFFSRVITLLTNRHSLNTNLPVYITGQREATHGSIIYVLDFVKRAGIQARCHLGQGGFRPPQSKIHANRKLFRPNPDPLHQKR